MQTGPRAFGAGPRFRIGDTALGMDSNVPVRIVQQQARIEGHAGERNSSVEITM